ncbi:hypothetical protein DH2020_007304 [Rehmannia glutinosa]|uniref:Myb-like domain-containing protein n=1 Tax=Rehmannia glutinosa TaxID=99300 RepID=A0ABR0TYP7_REHGL
MLGVSGLMGDGATATAAGGETGHDSGGGSSEVGGPSSINPGSGGGVMEEIERSGGGGNRWPRQETLALLKIRSEMDGVFRDASLKGPLWEDVSRKMAELGFQRSAKKCKEKFENVYKYHKRTKDGRSSKPDGKSYRFFDQLAALENTPPNPFTPPPPPPRPQPPATTTTAAPPNVTNLHIPSNITVSSISPTPLTILPPNPNTAPKTPNIPINSSSSPFQQTQPPNTTTTTSIPPQNHHNFQPSRPHVPTSLISNSTSSSSSTSSDEDIVQRRRGRKRKWKDYFERLMKDVIQKQEELQNKFIDALEKRERDRTAREEAWRAQEIARMNREHEVLVQERSIAAAKDTAVIAFLQKVTDQHNLQIPISNNNNNNNPPQQVQQPPENPQPVRQQQQQQQPQPPPPPPPPAAEPPPQPLAMTVTPTKILEITKIDNGGDNFNQPSSSRWPKTEVEALIKLRTSLDLKYQDNGPKGPLWEEISIAMGKLGYNRSSKRCKEKWENINKYYKKVKESNKKRPEDSKTCPYFNQLEAIYKERAINNHHVATSFNPGYEMKPENPILPIMARPEQQWPVPNQQQQHRDSLMHDNDSENHEDDDDEDDDDEDEGGGYEIIANNKQPSSLSNTVE